LLSITVGLKKVKRRFYNCQAPEDRKGLQLSFVSLLMKQQLKDRAVELQALPGGADADSNHNLLFIPKDRHLIEESHRVPKG
jgi:hypothetical protein